MNRKTTKKVDESTLTTLCAVCRGAFLDAKGVRLRRADPRQLVKDVCTYCQTRYGFDYYEGEYSRERLVQQLARTHPKTITQLAQKDTGSSANRHMRQILRLYNGASREMSLPLKN